MVLPAPARLSTTICCPSASPSFGEMTRVRISVPPPGANGTITRIDLPGYVCATAAAVATSSASPKTQLIGERMIGIDSSCCRERTVSLTGTEQPLACFSVLLSKPDSSPEPAGLAARALCAVTYSQRTRRAPNAAVTHATDRCGGGRFSNAGRSADLPRQACPHPRRLSCGRCERHHRARRGTAHE